LRIRRPNRIVGAMDEQRVGVLIDVPTMTAEQYDMVAARLGWTGDSVTPPEGLIIHVAGPTSNGWRIFDLWHDESSFRLFASTAVASALEGLPLPAYEPQVFRIHHSVAASLTIRAVGRPPTS
jgi:hypothetical protein